ncbi:MAG: HEPN domain-containing protein [Solirubrobacterales bacterium]
MAMARDRLANARVDLEAGHPAGAASAAYYAILNAARAALSERDRYAKTHSGTWALFSEEFVRTGQFADRQLAREASAARRLRELGDYEAKPPSRAEVADLIVTATRFVDAVASMLED